MSCGCSGYFLTYQLELESKQNAQKRKKTQLKEMAYAVAAGTISYDKYREAEK